MKKNIIQDMKIERGNMIKMLHRESPHYQPEVRSAYSEESVPSVHTFERTKEQKLNSSFPSAGKPRYTRKRMANLLILGLVLGAAYWCIGYFERTDVILTAKHQALILDQEVFTASKDPNASIPFEIMIVPDEQTKDMVLTESGDVSLKAHGEITLYNELSPKPQKISIGSMVSDESGKAYKTDAAVTIPGYTIISGKIVPGKIDVGVTAFLPGDSYNGSPARFTVNAYKGTTKFTKIYGVLKKPLSGGATGLAYSLDAQAKGTLHAIAESSFKSNLLKKLTAQVPPGYLLYPNAFTFSYEVNDAILSPTPNAKVVLRGTLSALLLKESDITEMIRIRKLSTIAKQERETISISDPRALSFNFIQQGQAIDKDMQSVQFALTGNLDAVWNTDTNLLIQNILGAQKDTLPMVFKSYPGIANASVKIFPPWHSHLPFEEEKIHILVK